MAKQQRYLYDRLLQDCQWKPYPRTRKVSLDEASVKLAVRAFFEKRGYKVDLSPNKGQGGYDIVCYHEEQKHWWIIEAKGGNSKSPSVDFPQCMGQLLLAMPVRQKVEVSFGIAIPDTQYYTLRSRDLPEKLRSDLQWHWFFVSSEGLVRPEEPPNCRCLG